MSTSRQADNFIRRHYYDLTNTFDVLVGKEPNQKRFTVHHDLLVQRSEFFKAARSSRWTQAEQPTTLVDHDPDTFSIYLHCLYFGVDAIKGRLSMISEKHDATTEPTFNTDASGNESSSDESSQSGKSADNDGIANGGDSSSSESNSDSDSAGDQEQNEQRNVKETPQKSPKKFTVLIDGKEKEATATLFVSNLSWTTEEKTLEQAFEVFGELRGVRIFINSNSGHSRGFGYVEFISAESAANALQARTGFELDGRGLRLDFSKAHSSTPNVLTHDQQRGEAQYESGAESHVSDGAAGDDIDDTNTTETVEDEISIDYSTSFAEEDDDVSDARTRVLIKLYVLADKLIDPNTANLVIDELVRHVDGLSFLPSPFFLKIVYQCTPKGSPLRAIFRDWHIHEVDHGWLQRLLDVAWNPPVDFINDIVIETGRLYSENRDRTVGEVFRINVGDRPRGHYHQKAGIA